MGTVALYFLQVRDLGVQYASMGGMDCAFLFDTGKYIYALLLYRSYSSCEAV